VAESAAKEQSRVSASQVLDRDDSYKSGLVGVTAGAGLIVIGIIVFPLVSSLWPVFLIIPGMILILAGLDNLSQTFSRPFFSRSFWWIRGGTMAMRKEAEREAEEERKLESGEAD
jgi:hypothetical protein